MCRYLRLEVLEALVAWHTGRDGLIRMWQAQTTVFPADCVWTAFMQPETWIWPTLHTGDLAGIEGKLGRAENKWRTLQVRPGAVALSVC